MSTNLIAEERVDTPTIGDINAQLHGVHRGEVGCDERRCPEHAQVVVLIMRQGQDNLYVSESRTMCSDHANTLADRNAAGQTIIIKL